jgi:FMN phosphatase YigB (HAD superfamily)
MVGDRLDNDIFPAKNIGMKTIWIKQGFGGMQNPKTDEYLPHLRDAFFKGYSLENNKEEIK